MAFKTGRSRTLTITGRFEGDTASRGGVNPGFSKGANFDLTVQVLGYSIRGYATADFTGIVIMNLATGNTATGGMNIYHAGDPPFEFSYHDVGTWSCQMHVEEWFQPSGTSATSPPTTIDGTDFSTIGGTAYPDGLPFQSGTYYEQQVAGTSIVVTCSITGVSTCSATLTETATGLGISNYGVVNDGYWTLGYGVFAPLPGTSPTSSYSTTYSMTSSADSALSGLDFITYYGDGSTRGTLSLDHGITGALHCSPGTFVWVPPPTGTADAPSTVTVHLENSADTLFSYEGHIRCFNQAYPDSLIKTAINDKLFSSHTLVGADTTYNWTQRYYAYTYTLNVASGSGGVNELAPVTAYLYDLPARGDDPRDWRLQFQMWPWAATNVTMDGSTPIAADTTVTHASPTLTITQPKVEGARYLTFDFAPSWGGDSRVLTISIEAKQWNFKAPHATNTIKLDLRAPNNLPGGYTQDDQQTRYPLSIPLGGPYGPDRGHPIAEGWLWGLNQLPSTATFGNIGTGETADVKNFNLTRYNGEIRALLPFQHEQAMWTSPTDTTYGDMDLGIWVDGKNCSDWPFRAHIVPSTGSPPTYTYFTLNDLIGFVASQPGWHTTAVPDNHAGPFATGPTYLLGAGSPAGYIDPYIWVGGLPNPWRDQSSMSPGALFACMKLDEITVYPGCGDPMKGYGPTNLAYPLRVSKLLRAQTDAVVFKQDGKPFTGALVDAVLESDFTVTGGHANADARGNARTGTPFEKGNKQYRSRLRSGSGTLPYFTAYSANRWDIRVGFMGAQGPQKALSYDVSPSMRHAVTFFDAGDLWVGFSANGLPLNFATVDSGGTADWAVCRWQRGGVACPLWVLYGSAGTVFLTATPDEGINWTMPISVASGTQGAFFVYRNQTHVYYLDGGTIKFKWYDALGNLIVSGPTNLTSIDDSPIAVDYSVAAGELRTHLFYTVSGTQTVSSATDGATFS